MIRLKEHPHYQITDQQLAVVDYLPDHYDWIVSVDSGILYTFMGNDDPFGDYTRWSISVGLFSDGTCKVATAVNGNAMNGMDIQVVSVSNIAQIVDKNLKRLIFQ